MIFRDNEPAALPPPVIVVANVLQNIIQAYQSDDDEQSESVDVEDNETPDITEKTEEESK